MMSERQRQVTKTVQIGWFIQAFAFLGFYAPFMYLWVFLLRTPQVSILVSVGVALSALLVLAPVWKTNRATLKRLEKYPTLFDAFFEAMIEDMERNDAEKGDTWITMDFNKLVDLVDRKWEDVLSSGDEVDDELPKISNYCAMLYLRGLVE